MQSEKDSEQSRRIGVDEQFIKFKPSPNFKNMKKFLKSKIDYDNTESNNTSPPSTSNESAPKKEENSDWAASEIQPPLPLDPPPPDSPPVNVKQEIEDTEYSSPPEEPLEVPSENLLSEIKADKSEEQPEKPKPTMCKDFIRGTCKRIGTCKFAHECDTSQLVGVYTFCRNFQNTVCTFPNCKYVHATIFEEQRFYRTGVLPAHCLAHHKKTNIIQPPPPPPPPEELAPAELPPNYINMAATCSHTVAEKSAPLMVVPTSALVPRPNNEVALLTAASPGGMEIKSCHKCDTMEYRLQYNKNRVDNMVRGIEDIDDKIRQVDKKQACLVEILLGLFRTIPKHHEVINNPNHMSDKDKSVLMEQIKKYLNAGNRINE